jgi:hypothetical protein
MEEEDFLQYVLARTNPDKNWDEDYELENGKYFNTCVFCKDTFVGHKRRFVCKKCAK